MNEAHPLRGKWHYHPVMSDSFVAFSNDTLSRLPRVKSGDAIDCPHCGEKHTLLGGTVEGKPSDLLLIYRCGEKDYLAAVRGHCIVESMTRRESGHE